MKFLTKYLCMAVAVGLGACLVSCDDDDDDVVVSEVEEDEEEEEEEAGVAYGVVGTYTGYTSTTFVYVSSAMITENESVTISASSGTTVDISYTSDTWGEFSISDAEVTLSGSTYYISGEGAATMTSHSDTTTDYDCEFEAEISDDLTVNAMTFTLPDVMGGTEIAFVESEDGEAPSAYVVAGSYSGYTSTTFVYVSSAMITTDETVTLTSTSETTVDVTYSSDTWGDFTISDVTVDRTSDGFTLSGTGTASMSDHSGGTTDYDCEFEGTIDSELSDPSFTFTLPDVMGGTVIEFIYGDAPAAYVIAGDYSGDTSVTFAYSDEPYTYEDESITITATSETTVEVTYSNETWGDYTVSDLEVSEDSDGNYTLSGNGTASISYHGADPTEYDCTFSATISSDLSTYSFSFYMEFMGGTTVTLTQSDTEE